jgi:hypothetical protein
MVLRTCRTWLSPATTAAAPWQPSTILPALAQRRLTRSGLPEPIEQAWLAAVQRDHIKYLLPSSILFLGKSPCQEAYPPLTSSPMQLPDFDAASTTPPNVVPGRSR